MRRSKFRLRTNPEEDQEHPRFPKGALWTLLAILLVLAVWQYDQREQRIARQHVKAAESLLERADYAAAIQEYRRAMENPRLGRKDKAQIALKIAELYDKKLDDPELALAFYNRARRYHPRSTDQPEIKAKMAQLREKIAELGTRELWGEDTGTTGSAAQSLLVLPPAEDLQGPVVARIANADIHAGAVARYLRERIDRATLAATQGDIPQLEKLLGEFFDRELAFRAAVARGFAARPGIAEQLYDYQRVLLSQQYLEEQRQQRAKVPEEEIRAYYERNRQRFRVPERISLGAIASTSQTLVLEAKRLYEAGVAWRDLVTSFCTSGDLRSRDGLLGTVSVDDKTLPLLGSAEELREKIVHLEPGKVLEPFLHNGEYWLIAVLGRMPAQEKSYEELRPAIEVTLASQRQAQGQRSLPEELRRELGFQLEPEAKKHVLEFLRSAEGITTGVRESARGGE